MTRLLHSSASPRGEASASLGLASSFLDAHRQANSGAEVEHFGLWDGTLPEFGPAGASWRKSQDVRTGECSRATK